MGLRTLASGLLQATSLPFLLIAGVSTAVGVVIVVRLRPIDAHLGLHEWAALSAALSPC
jgi:hypothetical protein